MEIHQKAEKLVGKKVKITMARTGQPFKGITLQPHSFKATILEIQENIMKIKKESGMTCQIKLKDQYMTVLDIMLA